ncbi:MAG: WD40 repeat domain-containing protein [Ignavibacteria bacterium]
MPERIIIEFDDEEEKPRPAPDENRIIIDFENKTEEDKKVLNVEKIEESNEEKIRRSKISSFYKGNTSLSNSFDTAIKFPEGIEQGFRKKFSVSLKDEFFNSLLENNKYIFASSKSGNIFLIDRFSGRVKDKIFFEKESFEKTGLVCNNILFANSLKKIFRLEDNGEEKIKHEEIYDSGNDFFIWSNLNLYRENIVFMDFDPYKKKAAIKMIDINDPKQISKFDFEAGDFVSDRICIAGKTAFVIVDNSVLVYDLEKKEGAFHEIDLRIDENSFIFYLNNRIYITTQYNELYYLDVPSSGYRFKNTGIKNNYINSIGGFDDNIFAGTPDGWRFYKSSGLQVYSFDDEHENRIECISKNVLVVSQKNKIVFCNLNRFQEAEGYVIASNEKNESVEIVSAVFSSDAIFVLTRKGNIEAFANDKMNIHL